MTPEIRYAKWTVITCGLLTLGLITLMYALAQSEDRLDALEWEPTRLIGECSTPNNFHCDLFYGDHPGCDKKSIGGNDTDEMPVSSFPLNPTEGDVFCRIYLN